jgi:hypothetical protein
MFLPAPVSPTPRYWRGEGEGRWGGGGEGREREREREGGGLHHHLPQSCKYQHPRSSHQFNITTLKIFWGIQSFNWIYFSVNRAHTGHTNPANSIMSAVSAASKLRRKAYSMVCALHLAHSRPGGLHCTSFRSKVTTLMMGAC